MSIGPSVVFTDLDDGTGVLLALDSKMYFSLNETGAFLWQACEATTPVTVKDLTHRVCEEYEIAPEAAAHDVAQFVSSLAEEGLIKVEETA